MTPIHCASCGDPIQGPRYSTGRLPLCSGCARPVAVDWMRRHLGDDQMPGGGQEDQWKAARWIAGAVADRYGVSFAQVTSKRRTRQVAEARHVGMYLVRRLTDLTLKEIGSVYGGRDHTTVSYGVHKVADAQADAFVVDLAGLREHLTDQLFHRCGKDGVETSVESVGRG